MTSNGGLGSCYGLSQSQAIVLQGIATEVIRSLSHYDLIVVCSGTNDYDLNEFFLTFRNIKSFLTKNNHTNILLMNIPFRYDLPNSFSINKNITSLNGKLHKLVKAFQHTSFLETDNNIILFTKHGLNRSKIGKKLVSLQLAHFFPFQSCPENLNSHFYGMA